MSNPHYNEKTDECQDSDGHWFSARHVCNHCADWDGNKPFEFGDDYYSFGIYATRACEKCWHGGVGKQYRDYSNPDAKFDPADAGEVYWEDEY